MTTDRPAPRGGVSPRSRRDDLLDDLRATVPVPAVPPAAANRPADGSPATDPTVGPATIPAPPTDRGTPAVEVRLTPLRWSGLRAAPAADRSGIQLSAGPLQVFLGLRAG
jgi:hypothetical protein